MTFSPWNISLTIWYSIKVVILKVGVYMGVYGFIPSHSWECKCDSQVALVTHPFPWLCFNRELKVRVMKLFPNYNNRFSFHMHMFIVYVLNINKLNTTIHSIMKFMVIAYNHNLHFRIHYKIYRNNITIHFIIIWHYKKFTQRNEHKIHYRSLCFSILLKSWI
jgi:hypothetical protein